MNYKKTLINLFAFLFIQNVWAASAAEILATQLQQVKTFSAHFKLDVVDEQGDIVQQSTGEMQFIRPAQFLWRTMPVNQPIVCYSDRQLISYDPELKQAIIKNSPAKSDPSLLPLTLLTGNALQAINNFSVNKKKQHYILSPRASNKNSPLLTAELYLDQSGAVEKILYKTKLGQVSTITFTHKKINKKLSLQPCLHLLPFGTDLIYDR